MGRIWSSQASSASGRRTVGATAVIASRSARGDEALDARVGIDCQLRAGRIVSLVGRNAGDVDKELRDT